MKSYRIRGGGGLTLHVVETGNRDGRSILFLHGFSQSHMAWMKQLHSDLAREFRLIAMDLRGHGLSAKDRDVYHDPNLWADDVQAVLEALDLNMPVICAWSFGTAVVGDYLQRYGDQHVAGFHFVSGVPGPDVMGDDWLKLAPQFHGEELSPGLSAVTSLLGLMTHHPLDTEALCFWLGFNMMVPPYVRHALVTRPPRSGPIPAITKPVLLTHGVEDRITLAATVDRGVVQFPHARAALYPGVGHAPQWEEPLRFNEELGLFVRSIPHI